MEFPTVDDKQLSDTLYSCGPTMVVKMCSSENYKFFSSHELDLPADPVMILGILNSITDM